jgi:hypothetical protein
MTLQDTASKIQTQIEALNASTDFNAYSGLTVEVKEGMVTVYDDYERVSLADPDATLNALKALEPINWDDHENTETAFEQLWDAINSTGGDR